MEHQNYTLEGILAFEHGRQSPDPTQKPDTLILADLSMISPYEREHKRGNVVRDVLFRAEHFAEVDGNVSRSMEKGFAQLLDAVRHGDIKVTPHCFKQFEKFQEMITSKTDYLHKKEQTHINKQSRRYSKEHHTDNAPREALIEMVFTLSQAVKQIGHEQYLPHDSMRYERMNVAIAKCWTPETKDRIRSLADESLVAAAVYRTLVEARPTAIITGDHDIAFLLNRVRAHLINKAMPYANIMDKAFREAFTASPARVYYARGVNEFVVEDDTTRPITPFDEEAGDAKERLNLAKTFLDIGIYKAFLKRANKSAKVNEGAETNGNGTECANGNTPADAPNQPSQTGAATT